MRRSFPWLLALCLGHLLFAAGANSAADLSPDVILLARAMNTNRDLMTRLPLYTCLETMERFRPKSTGIPGAHDVVQVDVGVGEGTEMYSWPGEATFSSLNLPDLIMNGLISTGTFSAFAHNLFTGAQAVVRFAGEDVIQGRPSARFTYTVPSLGSRWQITWNQLQGQLSESGEFWVDAQDFRLERMRVVAYDIPPQMMIRSLDVVIDYAVTPDVNGTTLLPTTGVLTVIDVKGKVYRNVIAFSHCHVFQSESKVVTSDDGAARILSHYMQQESMLPGGVTLHIALSKAVSLERARVGDAVNARLESAARLASGEVIPAGSVLTGRVRQLELLDDPPNTYLVGIAFSELVSQDRKYRFFAQLLGMQNLAGLRTELTQSHFRDEAWMMGNIQASSHNEVTIRSVIPGAAVFFVGSSHVLPEGFQMTWRTIDLARKE